MNGTSAAAAAATVADNEDFQKNRGATTVDQQQQQPQQQQQLVRKLSAIRRTKARSTVAASGSRQSMPGSTLSAGSTSMTTSTNRASVILSTLQVEEHRVRTAQLNGDRYISASDQQLVWNQLVDVEQLDIEDADHGLLAAVGRRVDKMASLASLSITWSPMKSVPGTWCTATFASVRSLILARNQLQSLDNLIASAADGGRFPQLETLDLSGNLLAELPKNFGRVMARLKKLTVSGNHLKSLPTTIGCMTELRSLDCACNQLNKLTVSICELTSLVQLDVSSNQLTELPFDVGKMSSLEDLRLSNNKLHTLPDSFARLSNLRSLSLAHNQFDHLPVQLSALGRLEHLNLSSNRIADIDSAFPAVEHLLLDDNLLQTVPRGICHSRKIRLLSLERNRITSVPDDIKLLAELRTLNLAGNQAVKDVPENVIGGLSSLRRLGLRSTGIRSLSASFVEAQRRRRTWIDLETPSTEEKDEEYELES